MSIKPARPFREVTSPLAPEALEPLPEDCAGVAFFSPLADDEYRQLASLLEHHPDKQLLALQIDTTRDVHITDLRFLRFFPNLCQFSSSLAWLQTLDGIEHLQGAKRVTIAKALSQMSAAPLAALARLDDLWLDGHFSERESLRRLTGLTNLRMGYAGKVDDLSFLPPNLTRFSMALGSVTDISALADLPHLRDLAFNKVRMISDLSPLAQVIGLRTLWLAYLNKVTHLFDMSALTELTKLTVAKLTSLTDLRPVLTAPNLTTLTVYGLPGLEPGSWHDTCTGWLAQGKPPFWQ